MGLEVRLLEFFKDSEPPSMTMGPNVPLYRGISLHPDTRLRTNNDETAWFCDNMEHAIGYAGFQVDPFARPHVIHARTTAISQLLRINLKELNDCLAEHADGPKLGAVAHWQKQRLLPALVEIWGVDGIFDSPTREFWLTADIYEVVEAVAV
jgi:hypothetical protein